MLDAKFVRDNLEMVAARLRDRGAAVDLEEFVKADASRRLRLAEVEQLKHRRNAVSEEVGRLKKAGQDAAALIAEMRGVGEQIKKLDEDVRACDEQIERFLLSVPNLP